MPKCSNWMCRPCSSSTKAIALPAIEPSWSKYRSSFAFLQQNCTRIIDTELTRDERMRVKKSWPLTMMPIWSALMSVSEVAFSCGGERDLNKRGRRRGNWPVIFNFFLCFMSLPVTLESENIIMPVNQLIHSWKSHWRLQGVRNIDLKFVNRVKSFRHASYSWTYKWSAFVHVFFLWMGGTRIKAGLNKIHLKVGMVNQS